MLGDPGQTKGSRSSHSAYLKLWNLLLQDAVIATNLDDLKSGLDQSHGEYHYIDWY